ncbi:E3 ubiquitin-protein ligase sina [Taenia solium]|eukprot:TsM_000305200 transcript=TsM_000305200 gene=TsM_000305200
MAMKQWMKSVTPPLAPANNMDLIILFACPVHMGFALSPILRGQSGHIVCVSYGTKLSSCLTCRGTLGKALSSKNRSQNLKYLGSSFNVPCRITFP